MESRNKISIDSFEERIDREFSEEFTIYKNQKTSTGVFTRCHPNSFLRAYNKELGALVDDLERHGYNKNEVQNGS